MNGTSGVARGFSATETGRPVQLVHAVKVGFRDWTNTTVGTVVKTERRRHGLHFQRNQDDQVFSDVLVLSRDDGELTTVTLDDFCELTRLEG